MYFTDFRLFLLSNVCIKYYLFSSQHCFICALQVLMHFYLVWCISFIYIETSSLSHKSFRSVLLSFQMFGDFSVIFVLVSSFQLVYSLIPLGLESTLCVIGTLKFVGVCFMAKDRVYLDECSMGTSKVCVFCYYWPDSSVNVH